MLPDILALVNLVSEGFFEEGSVELGRYLGNAVPVGFGLRLETRDSDRLDAFKFCACDDLISE